MYTSHLMVMAAVCCDVANFAAAQEMPSCADGSGPDLVAFAGGGPPCADGSRLVCADGTDPPPPSQGVCTAEDFAVVIAPLVRPAASDVCQPFANRGRVSRHAVCIKRARGGRLAVGDWRPAR